MATRNPDENKNPWLPVHDGVSPREAVAPSKPAMPAAPQSAPRPEPIDAGEAEVIAPVEMPPQEEILPSASSTPSTPPPTTPSPGSPTTSAPSPAEDDEPYRALGDAAVRNASLAASGVPTPLGGVQRVEPSEVHDGDMPRAFSPEGAATGIGWFATGPNEDAEGAQETGNPLSAAVSDDAPPYAPRVAAGEDPGPDGGDHDSPPSKAHTPWWRSLPFLIVVGLIVMGAIAWGAYLALSEPDDVELTAPVVVVSPEPPALDPITIDDPTDFQAALPGVAGAYALTAIDTPAPTALGLEVRAAEVSLMTLSDGETDVTLTAIQHFDEEAAVAQFEALAVDSSEREPVEAGGTPVGERATVPAEEGATVVWRNRTAVFEVTGPAEAVEAVFAGFSL